MIRQAQLHESFYNIAENAAICHDCMGFIISKHRHDFVTCECGNLSVDGGHAYLKRCFNSIDSWSDASTFQIMTETELKEKIAYYEEFLKQFQCDSVYYKTIINAGYKLLEEHYG